jgi:hypothetical protein
VTNTPLLDATAELNSSWRSVDEYFGTFGVGDAVAIIFTIDDGTYELSFRRHGANGTFRVCYREFSTKNLPWVPITDASRLIRIRAANHVSELRTALMARGAEICAEVDLAVDTIESAMLEWQTED